jgi:hypothetical protein
MVMKRKPSLRTTPAKRRRPTPIVRTVDGKPPPRARDLKGNTVLGATKSPKKTAPKVPTVNKKLSALVAADAKKRAGNAVAQRIGKVPVRRTKGGSKDMGSTSSRRKQNTQSTRATRLAPVTVAQAQKAASTKSPPIMGRNQRAQLERAALRNMRRKRRSV